MVDSEDSQDANLNQTGSSSKKRQKFGRVKKLRLHSHETEKPCKCKKKTILI